MADDPNTFITKNTARVIDIIAEGPIEEILAGDDGVYLQSTPLGNSAGGRNFPGVDYIFRNGTFNQEYAQGFDAVENEIGVGAGAGLKVTAATPVIRSITNPNVDAVSLRIQFPALFAATDKGDMKKTTVRFAIEYKKSVDTVWKAAPYSPIQITDKTNSLQELSYYISLRKPGGLGDDSPLEAGPWDIRVVRLTPDSTDTSKLQNDIYWLSYVEMVEAKMRYPDSAYVALSFDAEVFGDSIPARSYKIRGKKIRVWDNYDPLTRTYTGIWGGGFREVSGGYDLRWCNNPALCLIDLMSNDRYGADMPDEYIDLPALYSISRYCDGMVASGYKDSGGADIMEPRFALNIVIQNEMEVFQCISNLVSAFRGMVFWSSGLISFSQDKPRNPDFFVTPSNIIGERGFAYSEAAKEVVHNRIMVTWNNPAEMFKPDIEVVDDDLAIANHGVQPTDVVAVGCTSRGQAQRVGRWLLYSEKIEGEAVTYTAGVDHGLVVPGMIGAICNPVRAGAEISGRINSVTGTTVELDKPVTLAPGINYQLALMLKNGSLVWPDVLTGVGVQTSLTLSANYSADLVDQCIWGLFNKNAPKELLRVIAVRETETATVEVVGLIMDPEKFGLVESNEQLPDTPPRIYTAGSLSVPVNLNIRQFVKPNEGAEYKNGFTISWEQPVDDNRVQGYEVQLKTSDRNWYDIGSTKSTSLDYITDIQIGEDVQVRVRSYNTANLYSPWAVSSPYTIPGQTVALAPPTGVGAFPGFKQNTIVWTKPVDPTYKSMEIWGSNAPGGTAGYIATVDGDEYVHTGLGPNEQWWYYVRAVGYNIPGSIFVGPYSATTRAIVTGDIGDGAIVAGNFAAGEFEAAYYAAGLSPIKIVDVLPDPATYTGPQPVLLSTDGKLYLISPITGEWVEAAGTGDIDFGDITVPNGSITAEMIASIVASQITGVIAAAQVPPITNTMIVNGAISAAKLASGLSAVEIVSTLPTTGNYVGRVAYYTTDSKLYRWNGSWIATVPSTDIAGTLSDAQLAGLSTAKLLGEITGPQIQANAITASKILAGSITADRLLAGTITALQIAAGAITATQIAAGSITADRIVAGSITAAQIAANSITASRLVLSDTSNIFADPDMVDPASYPEISLGYGGLTQASGWNVGSRNFLFITANAAERAINGPFSKADGSAPYYISLQLLPGDRQTDVLVQWLGTDSSGIPTHINYDYVGGRAGGSGIGKIAGTFYAPVNAKRMRLLFRRHAGGTNDSYFGEPIIRRAANAELIVDGSITASKIVAGSISADRLMANTITAAQIATGAITANKLAVEGINLNPDPYFKEVGLGSDFWYNTPGGWYYEDATSSNTTAAVGIPSGMILWSGTFTGTDAKYVHYTNLRTGVTAGQVVRLRARCHNNSNQVIYATIEFFKKSTNTWLGNGFALFSPYTYSSTLETQATVPAGADSYRILINNAGGSAFSGIVAIGDIQVILAATGSMLVDGSITAVKIVAGTITGDKIAANTISASSLIANSITAGQIMAGAIGADQIAANAITAKHLLIGNFDNIIPDGDMWDVNWWTGSDIIDDLETGATVSDRADGYWGMKRSLNFNTKQQYDVRSRYFYVEPGATYKITFRVWKNTSGADGYFQPVLHVPGLSWMSLKAGASEGISGQYPDGFHAGSNPDDITSAYNNYLGAVDTGDVSFVFSVPNNVPGSFNGNVQFRFKGRQNVGDTVFQVRMVRISDATLIKDGSITTNKITANSITAALIAANTITAAQIAAGTITADRMNVFSISSISANLGTITAGYLQNASGSTYFDLNNGRIQFANPADVTYVERKGNLGSGLCTWFGLSSVPAGSETIANSKWAQSASTGEIYIGGVYTPPGGGTGGGGEGGYSQGSKNSIYYFDSSSGWQSRDTFSMVGVPAGGTMEVTIDSRGAGSGSNTTVQWRVVQTINGVVVAGPSDTVEYSEGFSAENAIFFNGIAVLGGSVSYDLQCRTTSGGGLSKDLVLFISVTQNL